MSQVQPKEKPGSSGRSRGLAIGSAKNLALKGLDVRPPRPTKLPPSEAEAEAAKALKAYQDKLAAAERQFNELDARKPLADTAQIATLIDRAKTLGEKKQYAAATADLDKVGPLYTAQKQAADAKEEPKTHYEQSRKLAEAALKSVVPPADPAPLKELLTAAAGLADLGQFAAAKARIEAYPEVLKKVNARGQLEQGANKEKDYKARRANVEKQHLVLTGEDYKGVADTLPLQKLLDAATMHAKALRFASAYDALEGFEKVAEAIKSAADKTNQTTYDFNLRRKTCKEQIQALKTDTTVTVGGKPVPINASGEVEVLDQEAARLYLAGKHADALAVLTKVDDAYKKAVKQLAADKEAAARYDAALSTANGMLNKLNPPLANVGPIKQMIADAQAMAEKTRFATAVEKLNAVNGEFAKQQMAEKKKGPDKGKYDEALKAADVRLKELTNNKLADPKPVKDLIDAATGLAGGGNFALAVKMLGRVPAAADQQKAKADGESKKKAEYEKARTPAENALGTLTGLVPLTSPATLERMLQQAADFAAKGMFASACEVLAGCKPEADARTQEANKRKAARDQYEPKLKTAQELVKALADLPKDRGMVEQAVQAAGSLAKGHKYDDAVNELDVAIVSGNSGRQAAATQAKDQPAYTDLLKDIRDRIDRLKDRSDDVNLQQAAKDVAAAEAAAANGRFTNALKSLTDCDKGPLNKAETEAAQDADASNEYVKAREAADGELAKLINLGDTASPDKLSQLIVNAEAQVARGRYKKALETIAPHTQVYNELVKLQQSEGAGKAKGKYDVALNDGQAELLDLQKIPNADAAEMERLVKAAEDAGKAGKFTSALALLDTASKEYAKQKKAAGDVAQLEKDASEYKPKYEERVKRATTLAGELVVTPGAEKAGEALRTALKNAADAAGKNRYKAAHKAVEDAIETAKKAQTAAAEQLKKVGDIGVLDKGYGNVKKLKGDEEKQIKQAGAQFKEARTTVAEAIDKYRKLGPPAAVQAFEDRARAAADLVMAARDKTQAAECIKAMTDGVAALNRIAQEVAREIGPCQAALVTCDSDVEYIKGELQWLFQFAPATDVQVLKAKLDKAAAQLSNTELQAARAKLESLRSAVDTLRKAVEKDLADWKKAEADLAGLAQPLAIYVQDPVLKNTAQELIQRIGEVRYELAPQARLYKEATQEAAVLVGKVGSLEGLRQQIVDFGTARDTADKEVKVEEAKVEQALADLTKKMAAAAGGTDEPHLLDLEWELKQAQSSWAAKVQTARDANALDKAGTLAKLTAVAEKIAAQAKDPGAAAKDAAGQAEKKAFEDARLAADKALEPLRARGGDKAAAVLKKYADLVETAPAGYPAAEAAMKKLTAEAGNLPAELDGQRTEAAVVARKRAADALVEIDKIRKDLTQWFPTSSDIGKQFAKFFDAQKKQVAELEGLRESGNLQAVASAEKDLDAIMSRTRAAAADARNTTPGGSSFKLVLDKLSVIEKKLKDPALKECRPTAQKDLKTEYTGLAERVKEQEPGAAMAALIKFDDALGPVLAGAAKAKEQRAEVGQKVTVAENAAQPLKGEAPTLYAKFKKQIAAAKAEGAKERGEPPAITRLGVIKGQIDAAVGQLATDPAGLAGKEKGARAEKEASANLKKAWESALSVFENKTLPAAVNAVAKHPEGDRTLLEDLRALRDKAEKAAKAGDIVGATGQLKNASVVADRVIQNPQGLKATSRDNLPGVGDRWVKAIDAVTVAIGTVKAAIADLAKAEQIKDLEEVNKAIDAAAGTPFDKGAFKEVIQTLTATGNSIGDRRASREAALQKVREYREKANSDPVLNVLFTSNPFAPVPLTMVKAALDDLELNILRCV